MKPLFRGAIALCFLGVFFLSEAQENQTEQIQSKVLFQVVEQNVQVQPLLRNASEYVKGLTYIVYVEKTNAGNASSSSQRGRLVMNPGDISQLSTSTQNLEQGEKLTVELFVYEQDTVLVHSNKKEYELKVANTVEESVQFFDERISGIVIDETKTKFGNDFYNEYYNRYRQLFQDNKETAYVLESPPIGRTTIVTVKIGSIEIFKARTEPGYEYLDTIVKQALARTELHIKTQENNIKGLKTY